MDHFESIIKTLLEIDGYWVRQSFKVNLTKEEKQRTGKPTIPRPEIDLLAFKPCENRIYAFEAKSYLDSTGVNLSELIAQHQIPEGRYKLFTCENYRNIVLGRLKLDLIECGMGDANTEIILGLAAGKVRQSKVHEIRTHFDENGWLFWSPEEVRTKVIELAKKGYENEPAIITAKILMRE